MLKLKRAYVVVVLFLSMMGVQVFANGLPGEFVLTQRWRDMIASYSPLTNPALMTEQNYVEGRLAYAPVLDGEFKLWEMGVTIPYGLFQSFGVSVLGEDAGNLDPEASPTLSPQGGLVPGIGAGPHVSDYFLLLSYAWNIAGRLSIGANVNFVNQTLGSPLSPGFDVGLTYRLLRDPFFGDHVIGLSTQNLINGYGYSSDAKLSWLSNYWEHRLESVLDFDLKDFMAAASEFKTADYSLPKKIEWDLNYKIGIWFLHFLNLYAQVGINQNAFDYWGFAAGVNAPSFNGGRDLQFLYQYNMMTAPGNDASTHTFYARADFGTHREEAYARKMARLSSLSPNDLYNKALKLYSEEKYWDALFVFSRIIADFPDFFKNDWVKYYRASCQEMLDMREVALKNFAQVKSESPLSTAIPYVDFGMMRTYYQNGDFLHVEEQYGELRNANVPDSLRFHGAYLMGQAYLKRNDLFKSIQVFSTVPETHPDYVFAQYSIAVAHAQLNDGIQTIIDALQNCVGGQATTTSQKEMVNRAYVMVGYIFYENNELSKAVTALRVVPQTSYYYEDALLGLGWAALKANQWADCISSGDMLTKTTKKSVLQSEGLLLQAYGYLKQKDGAQALALLKTASDQIHSTSVTREDTLISERGKYDNERVDYHTFAEKVNDISMIGISSPVLGQIDSLHTSQIAFVKDFDNYYKFSDEFKRSGFFLRSLAEVKEDIEYALATVQKMVNTSGVGKTMQKMDDQKKTIDSEIQKLKDQLKKTQ